MTLGLFNSGIFTLASNKSSNFKIDCDYLDDYDIETLSRIIYDTAKPFGYVKGVPTGGLRLADALRKYIDTTANGILIVDDVLTTGKSMESILEETIKRTKNLNIQGVVIFARGLCPEWITPLFTLNEQLWDY